MFKNKLSSFSHSHLVEFIHGTGVDFGPHSPQQGMLFRATVYRGDRADDFQVWFSRGRNMIERCISIPFPRWKGLRVNKMSLLKYSCKSYKLVLCLCRLQLTSGLALLKRTWAASSRWCLQIITSETALGLQSAGGDATATVAVWGASKTHPAELMAVLQVTPEPQLLPSLPVGQCGKSRSRHSPSALSEFSLQRI